MKTEKKTTRDTIRTPWFWYRVVHPKPGPFIVERKARKRYAAWSPFAEIHSYDAALQLLATLSANLSLSALCAKLGVTL